MPAPATPPRLLFVVLLLAAMIGTTFLICQTSYPSMHIRAAMESDAHLRNHVQGELTCMEEQDKTQWESIDWSYYDALRRSAQGLGLPTE